MASAQAPSKRCHNCRRQRLRCDRSHPQCNKCTAAGRECLGYGQLFRWTGSVASRGKLAGQTSSAAVSNVPKTSQSRHSSRAPSPREALKAEACPSEDPGGSSLVEEDAQLVPWSPGTVAHRPGLEAPRVLVDPLFQDMSQAYRYYLSYFVNRLCRDLVSYDLPDQNPFHRLLPLTRTHPLLQHVIVAASAAHMSNLIRPPLPATPSRAVSAVSPSSVEAARLALRDSLVAKHKALQLMHGALQDAKAADGDVLFAAALFLVNVELIESGKHGWRAHLQGAIKIMTLLQPTNETNEALRDYLLSDCFVYIILASAFSPAASSAQFNFQLPQMRVILQRAMFNSYLCSPPEVLEILYTASQLSNVDLSDEESVAATAEAGLALLRRAQEFDVLEWVNSVHGVPSFYGIEVESRVHAGSGHRVAACLYIVHAIPRVRNSVGDEVTESLSQQLFEHLESIPEEDPTFKATTWPTFILGAGAKEPQMRQWVTDRLARLVLWCPWGFLYTAIETLQVIWNLEDEGKGRKSWVQTLKDSDEQLLIV